MQSMNPLDGNPSSNIMMSLISSVSSSLFLIIDVFVEKVSVAVLSAAYAVEHLSAMIFLTLSKPIFCSNLLSIPVIPYPNDSPSNSFNSFIFCILVTFPPLTNEMFPVSSDTTTTSASLSSVIPIAALCLIPKFAGMSVFCVIGSVQRAAAIRPFAITIAPSWSGEFLKNRFMIRRR